MRCDQLTSYGPVGTNGPKEPIDVLKVIDTCAEALTLDTHTHYYSDRLREARAAVAELIEAGHAAMNACTEADQNAADGRLVAALARCGGA